VFYIHGHLPVFQHEEQDVRSFRMCTSQMIAGGTVKPKEIVKTFGVPMITVKRHMKLYRDEGTKGFYETKLRHSSASVLKGPVQDQAQHLLDEGRSVPEVAGTERLANTLHQPSVPALFEQMGITTKDSPSLYTSVHYVIAPNRRTRITCEIQVRTLAEELWGEVNHSINYPQLSDSLPCREQIKVLARVTSSCTRLVDAIFSSHEDHMNRSAPTDVIRSKRDR
jgi:hypothetical protein